MRCFFYALPSNPASTIHLLHARTLLPVKHPEKKSMLLRRDLSFRSSPRSGAQKA